ncbi:AbrB/MazE/SpoVT family DNA-binding domain-containing protein [Niveibacterium sp. SC-1]|uniref:AbrB/MazE/SpoVT family DNA-binding domain-containing protein n=1 Tax=Niveibacterium sp. SC-1 TaxID=3135646 RepID=UPI00311E4F78
MSDSKPKINEARYTSQLVPVDDGSGDVWLTIPDEVLSEMGCGVGDAIELEVEEGRLFIRKAGSGA